MDKIKNSKKETRVLMLVASPANLPIIKAAKEAGCYVITCDNNKQNIGHKFADETLFIDVRDTQSILEHIERTRVDAVISFVSAHGLKTAAMVSEKHNLNGYTVSSLETLTDKERFRVFLETHKLECPIFQCVDNIRQIDLPSLKYPIIIKPADKGASLGVKTLRNQQDLINHFPVAKNISGSGKVIIEEYIDGEALINGDCLIRNKEILAIIAGDYIYDHHVSNVLPIATVFPTKHSLTKVRRQLQQIVERLGVPDGMINFEAIIKNGKAYIIEINPRPSGNYLWKLMGYYFGFNVLDYLINLYLNKKPKHEKFNDPVGKKYAYQLFYSDQSKPFKGIPLPEELSNRVLDLIVFKKHGDDIGPFTSLFDRVGIALLQFDNDYEYRLYLNNISAFKL